MMLVDHPPILATAMVNEILSNFDRMPLLPGKAAVYLLLLLSVVSWSIILSKSLLISRIRNADVKFKQRLRRCRSCLEIYQRGESHEPSLLFDVYAEGSRAAVMEIAGTPDLF